MNRFLWAILASAGIWRRLRLTALASHNGRGRSGLRVRGVGDGVDFSLNADQHELPWRRESSSPGMGDRRVGKLLRYVEGVAYWAAAAPVLARLPAVLGYRLACWRGDLLFRCQGGKRAELAGNLRLVLGNELSAAAAQQVTRDRFRFASCGAVDVKRLRRGARPLRRLVAIHGREHLEAALARGNGAILCTGHFGSCDSGFSVLHTSGFPVTVIGCRSHAYAADRSPAERWFWELVYTRPTWRWRQRPNIEPRPDRFKVAVLARAALRANEVVTISIDAPPLDGDLARAVEVPFLGHQARLLPGVVALAQLTGAPLLMGFLYRGADYRHQVWEISAPVPVEGETATVFGRCAAEVSAAIRKSPAHWDFWATGALVRLGLIQPQQDRSPAAGPVIPSAGRFPHDGPTDGVPAQD
jgi:Kdo2-lipid IVA lauroyltransferase/acyltransferase